jgi:hypothetical protein
MLFPLETSTLMYACRGGVVPEVSHAMVAVAASIVVARNLQEQGAAGEEALWGEAAAARADWERLTSSSVPRGLRRGRYQRPPL